MSGEIVEQHKVTLKNWSPNTKTPGNVERFATLPPEKQRALVVVAAETVLPGLTEQGGKVGYAISDDRMKLDVFVGVPGSMQKQAEQLFGWRAGEKTPPAGVRQLREEIGRQAFALTRRSPSPDRDRGPRPEAARGNRDRAPRPSTGDKTYRVRVLNVRGSVDRFAALSGERQVEVAHAAVAKAFPRFTDVRDKIKVEVDRAYSRGNDMPAGAVNISIEVPAALRSEAEPVLGAWESGKPPRAFAVISRELGEATQQPQREEPKHEQPQRDVERPSSQPEPETPAPTIAGNAANAELEALLPDRPFATATSVLAEQASELGRTDIADVLREAAERVASIEHTPTISR